MEKVSEALYKSLRDDSEATVGIRALLGNTSTTPYNVYHAFLPENVDFSPASGNKGFITYLFVSGTPDNSPHGSAAFIVEEVYNVTAYHRSLSSVESIQRRIKRRLHNLRGVTSPTSQAQLHRIALDSMGPTRFDDKWNVYWQTALYRAWLRDDDLP